MSQSARPTTNLPVPVGPASRSERRARPRSQERRIHGGYGAQVLGQPGVARGLKAGRPAIDRAHCAYLGSEWSGSADRRRSTGVLAVARV